MQPAAYKLISGDPINRIAHKIGVIVGLLIAAFGSAVINFLSLPKLGGLTHETASQFLAFYWGGLMMGRFMGAFALSEMRKWLKHALVVLVPAVSV